MRPTRDRVAPRVGLLVGAATALLLDRVVREPVGLVTVALLAVLPVAAGWWAVAGPEVRTASTPASRAQLGSLVGLTTAGTTFLGLYGVDALLLDGQLVQPVWGSMLLTLALVAVAGAVLGVVGSQVVPDSEDPGADW